MAGLKDPAINRERIDGKNYKTAFCNIVTDENLTTEMLCKLARFAEFRLPLLRSLLPSAEVSEVSWNACDTQIDDGYGRTDIRLRSRYVPSPPT